MEPEKQSESDAETRKLEEDRQAVEAVEAEADEIRRNGGLEAALDEEEAAKTE